VGEQTKYFFVARSRAILRVCVCVYDFISIYIFLVFYNICMDQSITPMPWSPAARTVLYTV
jgi:hypothetical protein